jgi:purine-binding chemotaxis protein CheW
MLPMKQQVPTDVLDAPVDRRAEESPGGATETWVLFVVDGQIYALDLLEVERIVRAVEVMPLPEVPAYVAGVVDVHGQVLPVVDLRVRFDRPTRPIALSDHFIIARTPTHSVVLPVDSALGSRQVPADSIPPDTELPRCVRKVVPLDLGVVYSLDLQRLLFGDEPPFDTLLAQVLAELQKR